MFSPCVLITGASRGMGLATARILLKDFSASIVTLSRSRPAELSALAEEFPGRVEIVQASATDATASKNAVDLAVKKFGKLDGLILNHATLDPIRKIADVAPSAVADALSINFVSFLNTIQPALPHLRASKGRIVVVSSGAAVQAFGAWGSYCASKAACNSLVRTLATEEKEVASLALDPGVVDTDMQCYIRSEGGSAMTKDNHAMFMGFHADGVLVKPEGPGHVMAAFAVKGDHALSGQFLDWSGSELTAYRP